MATQTSERKLPPAPPPGKGNGKVIKIHERR